MATDIWIKIDSWHLVDESTDKTRCGRDLPEGALIADGFGDEKSCESCLRSIVDDEAEPAVAGI